MKDFALIFTILLISGLNAPGQDNKKSLLTCSDYAIEETQSVWGVSRKKAEQLTIIRHCSIEQLPVDRAFFASDTVAIIELNESIGRATIGGPIHAYYFYSNGSSITKCLIDAWIPFRVSKKKYKAFQLANMKETALTMKERHDLIPVFEYYTSDGINDGNNSIMDADQVFLDSFYYYSIMVFVRQGKIYELVLYRILGQSLEKEKEPFILVLPPF